MKKFIVIVCVTLSIILVNVVVDAFKESISHKEESVANEQTEIKSKPIEELVGIKEMTTIKLVDKPNTTVAPVIETIEEEPLYTEDELYVLSHVINGEAEGCSWTEKLWVGSVVLNRVVSHRYPDTIYDVVFDYGQYACTWDGNYDKEPTQESIDAAIYLLENGSILPDYVIFQSKSQQGDAIYDVIDGTYFCYYTNDAE